MCRGNDGKAQGCREATPLGLRNIAELEPRRLCDRAGEAATAGLLEAAMLQPEACPEGASAPPAPAEGPACVLGGHCGREACGPR